MNLKNTLFNKKSLNASEKNKLAHIYIMEDEFDKAYELLKENYEQNLCMQTANNLAYYYLYVGEIGEDDRMYLKPEKVIDILKDVEEKENMYFSYSMLGHAYYKIENLEKSLIYFEKAYLAQSTTESKINYAFLLYCNGNIERARDLFCEVYLSDNDRIYMRYCYLFCKFIIDNDISIKNDVLSLVENYDVSKIYEFCMLDAVYLLFLLKDYEKVISLYNDIFDSYVIEPYDFNIIGYSLNQLGLDGKIEKYYAKIKERYMEDYSKPLYSKIGQLNDIYVNKKYLKCDNPTLRVNLEETNYFIV